MVEQYFRKVKVVGSIPTIGSRKITAPQCGYFSCDGASHLRGLRWGLDLLPNNLMPAKRHIRLQAIFENLKIAKAILRFPQTAFARI